MGVPGFFMWIISNYNKNHIIMDKIDIEIDDLYLDANCLFHPQCFKVIEEYEVVDSTINLEQIMINKIIEYTDYIIKFVNPKKKIFIAVDGVAPMAKMNQQRKRRFKSVYDNDIRNKIKEKYNKNIIDWNNTTITPGTEFMEKLHNYIVNYIATIKHIKVIYSSYHTCGEGEHKIFEDIKLENNNNAIAIYGLDADLIFLSLATNMNNLYLLREKNVLNKKIKSPTRDVQNFENDCENTLLIYISVDALKWCINTKIKSMINIENNNTTNINIDFVNDFIFICYFLGNDFIPHIPSIDIYTGGLDMIIKNYVKLYVKFKKNILEISQKEIKINIKFLTCLLKYFSNVEDYYFKQIMPKYKNTNNKICKSDDPYDIDIWELDNLINVKTKDNINLGEDDKCEYKSRYYTYYYGSGEHEDILIDDMCREYFTGLVWTLKYYFKTNTSNCPSWDWQYPFTTSPFISDLCIYLENNDINKIGFEKTDPITPLEQLLIVLPPLCYKLLPVNYGHLMIFDESPIIDLYPIKVYIETTNIDMLWKAIPLLPIVNINRIKRAISEIKLNKKEQYRNAVFGNINNY